MRRWYFIGLLAAGCAVQPTPAPPEPPAPRSAEEAADQLDEAERALQAVLLRGEDQPAENGADDRDPSRISASRAEEARAEADRCTRACRALASMERSSERLCTLTGDGDERCRGAQHRLEAARRLVAEACPRCLAE